MPSTNRRSKAKPFDSGADMWNDYTMRYGIVGAHCVCQRYLKSQSRNEDASEKEFCRQLQDAMASMSMRKKTDVSVYPYSAEYAELNGETELFTISHKTNLLCADEINTAISVCEYGDGSVDFKTALTALTERYGLERLSFVLACEFNSVSGKHSYPDILHIWEQGVLIPENHNGFDIELRPVILTGLINELRCMEARLAPHDYATDFMHGKKPSLLGKLDDNKQKVVRDRESKKDQTVTCKRGDTEVTD